MLIWYIQHKIELEFAKPMHHDALHAAVSNESTDVIECLLAGGADANELTVNGSCVFSMAGCKNDINVMKVLLEIGHPLIREMDGATVTLHSGMQRRVRAFKPCSCFWITGQI